jgi:hypothetical protein
VRDGSSRNKTFKRVGVWGVARVSCGGTFVSRKTFFWRTRSSEIVRRKAFKKKKKRREEHARALKKKPRGVVVGADETCVRSGTLPGTFPIS